MIVLEGCVIVDVLMESEISEVRVEVMSMLAEMHLRGYVNLSKREDVDWILWHKLED